MRLKTHGGWAVLKGVVSQCLFPNLGLLASRSVPHFSTRREAEAYAKKLRRKKR